PSTRPTSGSDVRQLGRSGWEPSRASSAGARLNPGTVSSWDDETAALLSISDVRGGDGRGQDQRRLANSLRLIGRCWRLALSFVLERDLHLRSVALDLPVLDGHVEGGDLGDSEVTQ